jgi:hypothetical protein
MKEENLNKIDWPWLLLGIVIGGCIVITIILIFGHYENGMIIIP